MEKRKCRSCGDEQLIGTFPKAGKIKGVQYYRHLCQVCYMKSKNKRRYAIREWFVEYKSTLKCITCGNNDHRVLEFHHSNDDKSFTIADAVAGGASKDLIIKEINKCDVLCANCHRIFHYNQ